MKKIYLIVVIIVLVSGNSILFDAKSEDNLEDILQKTTNTILEKRLEENNKTEVVESGQIIFKAKKSNLWLKEKSMDKKDTDEFVKITLPGKLYNPPKEIRNIEKKDVDRSTLENTVASVFSANKSGDLDWISANFVDKDKEKIKALFENKKILEDSKLDAEKIISLRLIGQADYKDSVLVFVEQHYIDRRKMKEALVCKKTEKGWKVTNEFASDKTFDIVFAALSSGDVSLEGKESSPEEEAKNGSES